MPLGGSAAPAEVKPLAPVDYDDDDDNDDFGDAGAPDWGASLQAAVAQEEMLQQELQGRRRGDAVDCIESPRRWRGA